MKSENSNDDSFVSKQVFRLPFRCDDVNIKSRYQDTGSWESEWQVLGKKSKKRKKNSGKEKKAPVLGKVTVLTIQLVAEEKATEKKDKTPKKKVVMAAYAGAHSDTSDEDSSDSDESEVQEQKSHTRRVQQPQQKRRTNQHATSATQQRHTPSNISSSARARQTTSNQFYSFGGSDLSFDPSQASGTGTRNSQWHQNTLGQISVSNARFVPSADDVSMKSTGNDNFSTPRNEDLYDDYDAGTGTENFNFDGDEDDEL